MTNDATNNPTGQLLVGWAVIDDLLGLNTSRSVGATDDAATVELDAELLRIPNVAYTREAAVEAIHNETSHRLFTGLVSSVRLDGTKAIVSLAGSQLPLQESTIGGLVHAGIAAPEMIYCLLRTTGWPADRMDLGGWQPGPDEVFLVAAPVDGVELAVERTIAGVTLSPTNPARLDMPTDDATVRRFLDARAWAFTTVHADTVFDAEVAGLSQLDIGLSVFRAIGAYSYPVLAGELRPFDREHTRARIGARDVIFVGSIVSQRRWVRVTTDRSSLPPLPLDAVMPSMVLGPDPLGRDPNLSRALREWRVAADADDDFVRVTNLWRSVESYSKRGNPEALFTSAQRTMATNAALAASDWNDKQIVRIKEALGAANNPPLLVKFRAALEADEIDLPKEQFDALSKTRRLRNDLEHSTTLTSLEHKSLETAITIMNFILVSAFVCDCIQ